MTKRLIAPRSPLAFAALVLLVCLAGNLFAQAQDLPPKPDHYITDQASVLDDATILKVDAELKQFEKETTNQIVVAVYPSLPEGAELAQYATNTYNAWGVGQKGKDNGAILFVFVKSHKMFICTGRGLEGVLTDATCKNIIDEEIAPRFKGGDFAGGIQAGVDAMILATKDEDLAAKKAREEADFQAFGKEVEAQAQADQNVELPDWVVDLIVILFVGGCIFIVFIIPLLGRGHHSYTSSGFSSGSGFSSSDSFSSSSSDSDDFSSGGGSSAGGGAGGSW
jgi:uncharacterized protein